MKKTNATQYKSLTEHVNTLVGITDYIVDKLEKSSVISTVSLNDIDLLFDINLEFNDAVCGTIEEMLRERPEITGVFSNLEKGIMVVFPTEAEPFIGKAEKETLSNIKGLGNMDSYANSFGELLDYYSPNGHGGSECVIEKIIELSRKDFDDFGSNLIRENDLINENQALQYTDAESRLHCLFVKPNDAEYGILICNETDKGVCNRGYVPNLGVFEQRLEQKEALLLGYVRQNVGRNILLVIRAVFGEFSRLRFFVTREHFIHSNKPAARIAPKLLPLLTGAEV